MTWNILADGLHDDGFVVQRKGLMVRGDNAWDECLKKEDETQIYACLTEDKELPQGSADVKSTLADFILEQEKFKKLVIAPLKKLVSDFLGESPGKCTVKHVLNKIYGATMLSYLLANLQGAPDAVRLPEKKVALCSSKTGFSDMARNHMTALLWAMKKFDNKWILKDAQDAAIRILAWGSTALEEEEGKGAESGRGAVLLRMITEQRPDILSLQELDHYRLFQDVLSEHGYATTLGGDRYTLELGCASKAWSEYSEPQRAECRKSTRFARVAKFDSNAQRIHPDRDKCPSNVQCHDNDGIALFWNASRFSAKKIEVMRYSEGDSAFDDGDGGTVAVLLQDKLATPPVCLWAFATHLQSGETTSTEQSRLKQVSLLAPWIQGQTTDEHNCASTGSLLLMDGNTYENFGNKDLEVAHNMYHTLKQGTGLTNFAPAKDSADGGESVDGQASPAVMAISVNKIRGVATGQLTKMGSYQLDRIDYLAVSKELDQPVVQLPRFDRVAGRAEAFENILPSKENPSDHLPVVAEVRWRSQSAVRRCHPVALALVASVAVARLSLAAAGGI